MKNKRNSTKKSIDIGFGGENALAGVKRYNCVSDVCRNASEGVKDRLMLLSCGLWNSHLKVS
jgi:hypothetical protein